MNFATIALLLIAGLIIFDAILTYRTYKITEKEINRFKIELESLKNAYSLHTSSCWAWRDAFDCRFKELAKANKPQRIREKKHISQLGKKGK